MLERLKGSVPVIGKAFVLVANGERIYLGAFWTPISSVGPPGIPIITLPIPEDKGKLYRIEYLGRGRDPRNDERIYEILKQAGKLK